MGIFFVISTKSGKFKILSFTNNSVIIYYMKKLFILFFLICSSFLYAQNVEKLVISGFGLQSGLIEYDNKGLIKNFVYGNNSFSCSVLKQTDNQLIADVKWNIYGTAYESRLDIQISSDSIIFNSAFILPSKQTGAKNIKISGETFSNADFFLNLSYENFNYKIDKQDWILTNNSIIDKNSYGKIESGVFVRPVARVIESGKEICIGKYNCFEYEMGGFTYTCIEKISYSQSFDKNNISNIYKFLNFYLVSAGMDPSLLPFILLFPKLENFTKKNSIISYESTSFLKEKDTVYSAENLGTIEGLPWASANGYGIGDIIYITADINDKFSLQLFNGFQSEKKYLYEQNSRVKKIEITNLDTNQKSTYDIKDSAEKQTIPLQKKSASANQVGRYAIKILEVYPGTKYKDLCIQAILAE